MSTKKPFTLNLTSSHIEFDDLETTEHFDLRGDLVLKGSIYVEGFTEGDSTAELIQIKIDTTPIEDFYRLSGSEAGFTVNYTPSEHAITIEVHGGME